HRCSSDSGDRTPEIGLRRSDSGDRTPEIGLGDRAPEIGLESSSRLVPPRCGRRAGHRGTLPWRILVPAPAAVSPRARLACVVTFAACLLLAVADHAGALVLRDSDFLLATGADLLVVG